MKYGRNFLISLIAVCLIAGLLPVSAFAEESAEMRYADVCYHLGDYVALDIPGALTGVPVNAGDTTRGNGDLPVPGGYKLATDYAEIKNADGKYYLYVQLLKPSEVIVGGVRENTPQNGTWTVVFAADVRYHFGDYVPIEVPFTQPGIHVIVEHETRSNAGFLVPEGYEFATDYAENKFDETDGKWYIYIQLKTEAPKTETVYVPSPAKLLQTGAEVLPVSLMVMAGIAAMAASLWLLRKKSYEG